MKEELRVAKSAPLERKCLSDITNSSIPLKIVNEDSKPCQISDVTRDYVDQLIKENKELVKLIEQRNKLIGLSGLEIQRLKISYQKTQLQNRNLAQANSQMLAELNLGKDKLKALHHELGCKNALLKAKNLELQEKVAQQLVETGLVDDEAVSKGNDDKRKTICGTGNRRQLRSQSLGVPDVNKQDEADKVENKRRCVRRQSARFISQEGGESAQNMFEMGDTKFPMQQNLEDLNRELNSTAPDLSSNKEDTEKKHPATLTSTLSIWRPSRRAAEKVQSYKEPPLNIKMRR